MDERTVREAAQNAEKLVSFIKNETFKTKAFGVLFDRLPDWQTDKSIRRTRSRRIQHPPAARQRRAKAGPLDRLRELAEEGFFKSGRSLKATLQELANRGHTYDAAVVGKGLQRLAQDRVLRRSKGKEGKKKVFLYSNW